MLFALAEAAGFGAKTRRGSATPPYKIQIPRASHPLAE